MIRSHSVSHQVLRVSARRTGAQAMSTLANPCRLQVTKSMSSSWAIESKLPTVHSPDMAHHQYYQMRHFDHRKTRRGTKKKNPFKVLGVPEGATLYKDAKSKFLRIAMSNHPDTHDEDMTEEERENMRDTFIAARVAFESLAEDPMDGLAILVEDLEDAIDNFDSWFKNETGLETPFQFDMDPETMKEVAQMTEKIGGGLDRDGGMWALARMVTSTVKSGGDAATMLRLEGGDIPDQRVSGLLRRRRRRR